MLVIKGQECKDISNVLNKEWTESNILGGYIHNNLICHNNKAEHSLLSIPFQNSFLTLISGISEEIIIDNNKYSANYFKSDDKDPGGKIYLEKFYIDIHPNFIYNFQGNKLLKSIIFLKNSNTVIIKYKSLSQDIPLKLLLSPLISVKKYDTFSTVSTPKYKLAKKKDYIKYIHSDDINIFFYFNNGKFNEKQEIIKNSITKTEEKYLAIGEFEHELNFNDEIIIAFSNTRIKEPNLDDLYKKETADRTSLINKLKIKNELYKNIILSSNFYLKKTDNIFLLKNSLISTEVSFQSMLNSINILFTLRDYETMKHIFQYLSDNIKQGLIPEKYDNNSKKFIYDSIDNSFWYLLYVFKFIEFTSDWKFIKDSLWTKIRLIFNNFYNNHISNIKIDFDGLLIVNPDSDNVLNQDKLIAYPPGKNLAINILWYNSVKIIELLSAKYADIECHTKSEELSKLIRKHLYFKFWNKEKNYFNNGIDIPLLNTPDDKLTPYQIFIISLPFDDLTHYKTKIKILNIIKEKLLTPYGLRTLSPDDKDYISNYKPDQIKSAYHGTIHPYLLFHYLTAYLKLNNHSKTAKKETKYILINYEKKIKNKNIGFFPQFNNSLPPFQSAGYNDYSLSLSEYIRIRNEELGSL